MKVTLKYEEGDDKSLHMTLKLTLPQKYVNGPTKEVIKLFVDHYNKKNSEKPLDVETFHLKVAGGNHLGRDALVKDAMAHGNECFILPEGAIARSEVPAPAQATGEKKAPRADGKLRCKRFGCQKYYDPEGPEQKCVHHKSPPIFHETAKWWSCCPDKKAYDFEDFMAVPGCQTAFCSNDPAGQNQKRFLGGQDLRDLRDNCAPVRLDADAPPDPRQKLNELRSGLVAVGVSGELFDKILARQFNELGDFEKVLVQFKNRFGVVLNSTET